VTLVDVSELFSDPEFMKTVTLRRPTVHFANEGEAIASYEPDADFTASVQPVPAAEVAELPEGQRGSGKVFRLYTGTELKFSPGRTDISDVVVDGARELVVVGEEPWGDNGYFKFLAVELLP
jgi:hypothetical protein